MNEKAMQLGMKDTHFLDCCGLSNDDNHYTTAKDVALMSRALITRYPQVFEYTKIWMEDIVHETTKGTSAFTLSSTNKLLKQYEYTTGLKTGSTNKAKYCFSATAQKDGVSMIAVVMAAPDYKIRFEEARRLLEYGFDVSHIYRDEHREKIPDLNVKGGVEEQVAVGFSEPFVYLDTQGNDLSKIVKKTELPEEVSAPVTEGDLAGRTVYYLNGAEIGSSDIIYFRTIEKSKYKDYLKKVWKKMLL
jgi:D-alanyl-D-alanine carboxypeptidase (penicillin-binding protein 5/6)